MHFRNLCLAAIVLAGSPLVAQAQFKQGDTKGPRLGEFKIERWQAGTIVSANSGPCTGIAAYLPVPIDWPEQEVRVVEEDVSPSVKITYQTIDRSVKVMTVRIARLPAGDKAKALSTMEIKRFALLPPENTDTYELPDPRKLDASVRIYLGPSPYIESRNARIRSVAKEIGTDKQKAWELVEAIYDWVREKVKFKNGPLKGAMAALRDGTGDCEELTSLFIAICRARDIPARTVWVPGHCYPEFYLVDEEGNGHWFPCQAAGTRAFGGIPEFRPILQKGDNFRPPYGHGGERQRYLAEYLTGTGGKPRVQFVRKLLPK